MVSIRFKVFERDNFTCQYCGQKPPQVILHLDHIHPKSRGGSDDEINLITSCQDCNLGKKDKVIKNPKNKSQIKKAIEDSKESEQQLDQYYKFLRKKEKRNKKVVDEICEYWSKIWDYKYALNYRGQTTIKGFLSFLQPEEIKESMDIARCKIDDVGNCFKYFCGVVYTKRKQKLQ